MGQGRRDRWRESLREPPAAHEPEDQFLATYRLPLTQDGCQTGGTWSGQLLDRDAALLSASSIPGWPGHPRPVFSMISTDKSGARLRPPATKSSFRKVSVKRSSSVHHLGCQIQAAQSVDTTAPTVLWKCRAARNEAALTLPLWPTCVP